MPSDLKRTDFDQTWHLWRSCQYYQQCIALPGMNLIVCKYITFAGCCNFITALAIVECMQANNCQVKLVYCPLSKCRLSFVEKNVCIPTAISINIQTTWIHKWPKLNHHSMTYYCMSTNWSVNHVCVLNYSRLEAKATAKQLCVQEAPLRGATYQTTLMQNVAKPRCSRRRRMREGLRYARSKLMLLQRASKA